MDNAQKLHFLIDPPVKYFPIQSTQLFFQQQRTSIFFPPTNNHVCNTSKLFFLLHHLSITSKARIAINQQKRTPGNRQNNPRKMNKTKLHRPKGIASSKEKKTAKLSKAKKANQPLSPRAARLIVLK